jgi:hypothetical protein
MQNAEIWKCYLRRKITPLPPMTPPPMTSEFRPPYILSYLYLTNKMTQIRSKAYMFPHVSETDSLTVNLSASRPTPLIKSRRRQQALCSKGSAQGGYGIGAVSLMIPSYR